jgi:chaperonin GroES
MSYNIKPQGARVLLLPENKSEKVIGGVILPSAAQDALVRQAKVVQWGADCKQSWNTGDTVMIGKDAGLPVKLNDAEYVLIGEDDILAIVTEDVAEDNIDDMFHNLDGESLGSIADAADQRMHEELDKLYDDRRKVTP